MVNGPELARPMIKRTTGAPMRRVIQDLLGQFIQPGDGLHVSLKEHNISDAQLPTGVALRLLVCMAACQQKILSPALCLCGHSREVEYIKMVDTSEYKSKVKTGRF